MSLSPKLPRGTPRLPVLILCFAMLAGLEKIDAADTEPAIWQVEIDVFSGHPNPVFTLQESEAAQVKALLSKAQASAKPNDINSVFPSRLGYRGIFIRQVGTNQTVVSEIQLRGKDILQKSGAGESWQGVPDRALEQYLLDLAQSKGAISAKVHGQIDETIARGAKNQ